MTWLNEVEKAFAANLINDHRKTPIIVPHLKGSATTCFRPNFITQFCTPILEGKWFAQLATRKQQLDEDVDTYHTAIQELLRRVDACKQNLPSFSIPLSALYAGQIVSSDPVGLSSSEVTSGTCRVVNSQPSYTPNQAPSNPPLNPIQASLNLPNPSIPTPVNNNTENRSQEALQALLALATNLNSSAGQNDHHTYVNISAESAPLFAVEPRDPQRPSELEEETEDEKTDSEKKYEEEELEDRIYAYGEIADIETFSPLPLFLSTPSILDTPIDIPCTLLELPFLPLTPKNKTNYPLIDLSIPYSNNSSYLIDSSKECQNNEIWVHSLVSENLTPSICYDFNTGSSGLVEWYSFFDLGTLEVEEDEYYADKAGNTYLQENNAQPDLSRYITVPSKTESLLVSDLFDYFYEERQDPYQLGKLESKQHFRIQQFIAIA
ncbi:11722_t:CDS:2 [Gigaspora rosea]|nr:11722_t:CDS:2 [Gigaspora rosea]